MKLDAWDIFALMCVFFWLAGWGPITYVAVGGVCPADDQAGLCGAGYDDGGRGRSGKEV